MKYLSEFRDSDLARRLVERIHHRPAIPVTLMEVCGTHTVSMFRHGIRQLLPAQVNLVSGPGCPVCVTAQADIDYMLALAQIPHITLATFGDMLRVPGSHGDLTKARAQGADVRIVYSPLEAVALAGQNRQRQVVFLGIGFETTVPTVAAALAEAGRQGLSNFSIFSAHKLAAPIIRQLLADQELRLDGLILPGHVSAITGRLHFDFVAAEYGVAAAITGFDSLDLLAAVREITNQLLTGTPQVANCYRRVVKENGNPKAWLLVERFFTPAETSWRGLGSIPDSGLALRPAYRSFEARRRFPLTLPPALVPRGCQCGEVLKGKVLPFDCRLFDRGCNPLHPVGPCMVSAEGTCAAYYKYERRA